MDQEFREYLDRQFKSVDARLGTVDKRLDLVDRRLDSADKRLTSLEAEVRHTNVLVEDLRGQIQLVAEGVATVEKLESA